MNWCLLALESISYPNEVYIFCCPCAIMLVCVSEHPVTICSQPGIIFLYYIIVNIFLMLKDGLTGTLYVTPKYPN